MKEQVTFATGRKEFLKRNKLTRITRLAVEKYLKLLRGKSQ